MAAVAVLAMGLAACKGDAGPAGQTGATGPTGPAGADATANGTLSGAVLDTYGNKVAGATVTVTVGTDKLSATTDANGAYTLLIPPSPRTVTVAATGYTSFSQSVEVAPAKALTLNVTLNPTGPAAITAARTDTTSPVVPGTQVSLKASLFVFDPALKSQAVTYAWTVVSGPAVTFDSAASATPKATLASAADFKKYLVELATPSYKVNPDEPPVNVDRYQVVPFSYEQALSQGNTTKLKVTATVGGQSYSAIVSVAAVIPAVPSTGLQNVPVNAPVVLQGQFPFKDANGAYVFPQKASWNWSVTGPSAVTLNDATTAYPDFTPTAPGTYVVNESGTKVLEVYAGTYQGAMTGPGTADPSCMGCHNGTTAPDNFTSWLTTGHKEVMYAGIMEALPGGHYTASCTPCHTAGNGRTGSGGFADKLVSDQVNFSPLQGDLNAEADFWALYPASAKLAGVQCENCHGPQAGSGQHVVGMASAGVLGPRVSYSASVCATCHARAPKHGRYPQWLKSGHASFATFTFNSNPDGTLSNTCACCHNAQGFKAYRAILPTANGDRSKTVLPAGLTITNAQPITCQACHDAHDEGDLSKAEWTNLAKVGPSEGTTYMLPSGFAATGVGKGALCIACHNSRQGFSSGLPRLHEDGDAKFGTTLGTQYGAPHEAAQGDVLLGRNAYWFGTALYNSPQTRSKHSYITDTCVTCHMELTTLDPTLSEAGQTRHDFKATTDVCNKCHTAYSTDSVQAVFDGELASLKAAVGTAILQLKTGSLTLPAGTTAVLVANRSGQVDVTTAGVTQRWFISTRTGQDAFLADPNNGGALVQGCVATATPGVADCTGYLAGAPGIVFTDTTLDGAVSATGYSNVVAKALWNTVLVQDDASRGVHNPSFTFQVIDNTMAHVTAFAK